MTNRHFGFAPQLGLHDMALQSGFSPFPGSCSGTCLTLVCLWVQRQSHPVGMGGCLGWGDCRLSRGSAVLRAGSQLGQPASVARSLPP